MKTKLTLASALAAITINAERLTCYGTANCSPLLYQQVYAKAYATLCNSPGDPDCGTTITLAYYGVQPANVRMYVVGYRAADPNPVYLEQRIVNNTAATVIHYTAPRCGDYATIVGHTIVNGGYSPSASVTVTR